MFIGIHVGLYTHVGVASDIKEVIAQIHDQDSDIKISDIIFFEAKEITVTENVTYEITEK